MLILILLLLLVLVLFQNTTFAVEILTITPDVRDVNTQGRAVDFDNSELIFIGRALAPDYKEFVTVETEYDGQCSEIAYHSFVNKSLSKSVSMNDVFFDINGSTGVTFDPVIGGHLFRGEYGRSSEDLVGVFSIQKEIRLSDCGLCTGDGLDWLSTS